MPCLPRPPSSRASLPSRAPQTCGPTPGGWGTGFALLFFDSASGASQLLMNAGNPPNNVYNFAGPIVTAVSVLTGGSTTSTTALPLKTAGTLLIDLSASDYNATSQLWDNRATPGPVSVTNGDFGVITYPGGAVDHPPTQGLMSNVTSVIFTFNPYAQPSLSTYSTPSAGVHGASPSLFQGLFGGNTWSMEALVMPIEPSLLSTQNEVRLWDAGGGGGSRRAASLVLLCLTSLVTRTPTPIAPP